MSGGAGRNAAGPVPGSGDAAVEAQRLRTAATRELNLADATDLPVPGDTANLRQGPDLHPDCLSLLPLIGVWRGTGHYGNEPRPEPGTESDTESDTQSDTADFGQQISVSHDGRAFLRFESISWELSAGEPSPGPREVGWLRPQPDGTVALLLAHAEGRIEVFYGQQRSIASWALTTDGVLRTPAATPVIGASRLYGITGDGRLAYVEERAHTDAGLVPHASALLDRVVG